MYGHFVNGGEKVLVGMSLSIRLSGPLSVLEKSPLFSIAIFEMFSLMSFGMRCLLHTGCSGAF